MRLALLLLALAAPPAHADPPKAMAEVELLKIQIAELRTQLVEAQATSLLLQRKLLESGVLESELAAARARAGAGEVEKAAILARYKMQPGDRVHPRTFEILRAHPLVPDVLTNKENKVRSPSPAR